MGLIYWVFERWIKGTLGMKHLSLERLSVEGLWGVHPYWGPCRLRKEGSGNMHLSSWGLSWATWSGLVYQGL